MGVRFRIVWLGGWGWRGSLRRRGLGILRIGTGRKKDNPNIKHNYKDIGKIASDTNIWNRKINSYKTNSPNKNTNYTN